MTFYLRTMALLFLIATAVRPIAAQVPSEAAPPRSVSTFDRDAAIVRGRSAMRRINSADWYDRQQDTLRPVELTVKTRNDGFLDNLIFWLLVATTVVVLGWLSYQIIRAMARRNRRAAATATAQPDPLVGVDWVEALPFLRERSREDLLGQARRHYQAGNYAEAIIYLFSHELVELDRAALVRLTPGKTNRQYVRELGRVQALAHLLEQTMLAFEDVFFGGLRLDRDRFEACWNELDTFDHLLSNAGAAP
jgi:hypothetical protein